MREEEGNSSESISIPDNAAADEGRERISNGSLSNLRLFSLPLSRSRSLFLTFLYPTSFPLHTHRPRMSP